MEVSQWLTPAIVSLITLAVALPIQNKVANSKALETVEKVYSNVIKTLSDRVEQLEARYKTNHCEKAPNCKQRVK